MSKEKEIRAIEIFRGMIYQAHMVVNLLENAGIDAYLQDEISGTLNMPWDSSGGVGMVKVTVSSADYEKAQAVVKEYEQNLRSEG
ncbi:MAG: DUF2007 domain-containing protein [Bacteroidetes bacterium]|nr:MAG: DUF2007 domain-containing protein [Bacteroidota bacterium]